jgi:hypothetical protein
MQLGEYVAQPGVIIFLLVALLIGTLYVFFGRLVWKSQVVELRPLRVRLGNEERWGQVEVTPGKNLVDTRLSASIGSEARATGEWEAYELNRVMSASNYLCMGTCDSSELALPDNVLVSQIVAVARNREQIRKALVAYLSGGATGLFDAYEAVSCEIMNCSLPNYAADEGTREWLVRHGWVSEEEEDRFLKTVQHFRHGRFSDAPPHALSPHEARLFVRGILMSFIQYSLSNQQST